MASKLMLSNYAGQKTVMNGDTKLQGGTGANDPLPDTQNLYPRAVWINPSDASGADEPPDNDGDAANDSDDEAAQQEKMLHTVSDNVELDDQSNLANPQVGCCSIFNAS